MIIDVNPAFFDITGYSFGDVIGKSPNILSSGKHGSEFYQKMWQQINDNGYWQGEIWNRKKTGELYAELLSISALNNDDGNVMNYIGLFSDITNSKRQQETLELMAHYDVLTKLPNRKLFSDRFTQALAHTHRSGKLLAICFLDLDKFKPVNDNFGHDTGDQLLIEVAERIKATIREDDTISRQGGDEFALLLSDLESVEQCKAMLERIHHALSLPFQINGHTHQISASSGVTFYPSDNSDITTLIRHADQAMYQAKLMGRNRSYLFNTHDNLISIQKYHKVDRIHHALINDEFQLYYQPKVNMKNGKVYGAEALIRWNHPDNGIMMPLDFLPIIEGTDEENKLGYWVIEQALMQLNNWLKKGIHIEVSVNVSPKYLQSISFVQQLEFALKKYPQVDSKYLQLEVLETSVLNNLHDINSTLKICQQALGVTVSLDDFGTGYSSLTHLRSLSAGTIKIDQSFVRGMLDDPDDFAIIDGVLGLTTSFGKDVIAEGVETTEHGVMLLIMGCEKAQGYSIAKPMPADKFLPWLNDYRPNQAWIDCGVFQGSWHYLPKFY